MTTTHTRHITMIIILLLSISAAFSHADTVVDTTLPKIADLRRHLTLVVPQVVVEKDIDVISTVAGSLRVVIADVIVSLALTPNNSV